MLWTSPKGGSGSELEVATHTSEEDIRKKGQETGVSRLLCIVSFFLFYEVGLFLELGALVLSDDSPKQMTDRLG